MHQKDYQLLQPCEESDDIQCYMSWASYQEGCHPNANSDSLSKHLLGDVCINPVSWNRDTLTAEGKGGFLLNMNKNKFKVKSRVKNNYLWVDTNTTFFKRKHNLHTIDFNLFWYDIRGNVKLRVDTCFEEKHN